MSGTSIVTTVLDGDYRANNQQWQAGPVVDVSVHGPMLLVSQQRWLTVEDGRYDTATWLVNGARVWSNPATSAGSAAHLDLDWVNQDVEAASLVAEDGTISMAWTLGSDQGLEFGGWALDDVCIYDLDDVPGHYRVHDLVATDTEPQVTLTWSQPWIAPLTETVLLRRWDAPPTGPEDGVVLDRDTAPTPGAARSVVDPEVLQGQTAWYAVFAANDTYYLDGVIGENVDGGGVPAPPPPDTGGDTGVVDTDPTDPGPTDSTPADTPKPGTESPTACGCATPAPGGAPWVALAVASILHRRRRERP